MTRELVTFLGGTLLALNCWAQFNPVLVGIVTAVMEGDTIKVQLSSGPIVVRLANIDAPEWKQPGGPDAKAALDRRVLGEQVSLDVVSKDWNGPVVAVVHLGDENINAWMVKQGHAWAYRQEADDADYCVWENAARSLRRGLWAGVFWTAPWEWRLRQIDKKTGMTDYGNETVVDCINALGANTRK